MNAPLREWTFTTTEARDAFIDREFPQRRALDCPGTYRLPDGRCLTVCLGEVRVWPAPEHPCPKCGGAMEFSTYCGARVCDDCGHHKGLARCYCGWSASGGNGRAELEAMGETIDPE
jgi:hypothetical protein